MACTSGARGAPRRIAVRDTRDWWERRDTRNQGCARRACRARRARRAIERLADFFSTLLDLPGKDIGYWRDTGEDGYTFLLTD